MRNTAVKRSMLVIFACFLVLSLALAGCGGTSNNAGASTASNTASGTGAAATSTQAAAIDHSQELTIDVYDNAANYQGEQTGWYAKILKDKLNLKLNILAPQVAGDQLYKTRSAAGNLGDLLIIDNSQLEECIQAGLVADMTDLVKNSPNLSKYLDNHFKVYNASFKKVNPDGKIYGLPTFEVDSSPTKFSEEYPYSSPILPWKYYSGIGAPEIKDLNGLLDVLQQMHEKFPKTEDGKPIVPITLWKDWDTWSMENVRWLCGWYGWEQPEGTGSVLLNAKGDIVPFTDDNSMYKKILQFYFNANQRGLVDPDSASQDWNKVNEKLTGNRVMLLWYTWQRGFYNTIDRGNNSDGVISVPISDTHIIQNSDAYYGNGRAFALGSKAKDPARVMEFVDWISSPEGMRYVTDGLEGFNYVKNAEGKFELTEAGKTAFQNNTPVPAEYGGGGYQDGQSKVNSCVLADMNIDPDTGETYNTNYWSSYLKANQTKLITAWQEKYQAKNPMDYYTQHNMIDVVPQINMSFGADSSDIKNKRSQCSDLVKNTSWKMIFAKNQAEFDQLWTKLKSDLQGLGWNDVVAKDTETCKAIADARATAMASVK